MRLAYFTPLPPSKSGIADYNVELLPYLARGAEITVFVEHSKELRENQGQDSYEVRDAACFDDIDQQIPFDLCIYHQGNNPYHEYIYERAMRKPGLVVLHEPCLHHLIAGKTLARDDRAGYWDEMFYVHGRLGARIAEMRAGGVCSEYQQFLLPLNRRLVSNSLGVIVHNAYAASQLETVSAEIPVGIIPHHLSPRAYGLDEMDRGECRRSLGIPDDAFVIASHGFVTQSKRIPVVLAAFKRLLPIVPNAMYIIVGEDHSKWGVTQMIGEMGLDDRVRVTGYTSEEDFFRYLKAADVVVNLRFPTAGETSGTLTRALGAGKPVIVTDFGQFAELPDDICLKVSLGPDEEKELYARLRALAYRPELRKALGDRASAWTRDNCEVGRSAAFYLSFSESIIERHMKAALRQRHHSNGFQLAYEEPPMIEIDRKEAWDYVTGFFADNPGAMGYLSVHQERILETIRLVPVGQKDHRLLELSSYLQMTPLIKRFGNYGEIVVTNWWQGEPREKTAGIRHSISGEEMEFRIVNLDVEHDRFPFPDGHFNVALCCELIEHLTADPMHMLIELNRVLKWGGLLIVTTPNISSASSLSKALSGHSPYVYGEYNTKVPGDRHSREFVPGEIQVLLNAAGFKAVKLYTRDLWSKPDEPFLEWLDRTGVPRELRGENIFAVGRKQSVQLDRYPLGLYD